MKMIEEQEDNFIDYKHLSDDYSNQQEEENQEPKERELDLVKTFAFLGAIVLLFFAISRLGGGPQGGSLVLNTETNDSASNPFDNISLEAKAAFVWDVLEEKEIYSLNPETQMHLASLSKVVMALTAYDIAPPSTIISINFESLQEEGDTGLFENEKWTLKDLIDFSLLVSSNDGSTAIAGVLGAIKSKAEPNQSSKDIFTNFMNEKAKEIGLKQTYFISPTGLDKDDLIPGGQGSARDMAILFEYVLKNNPEVLEATGYSNLVFDSLDGLEHRGENTNELVGRLPGIFASKTGFTDLAGGNLVVAFNAGIMRPIVISVMGSSLEGRFSDVEDLYRTTLRYLAL